MNEANAAMKKFKLRLAIVEESNAQQDIKDEEMNDEKFWGQFAPDEDAPVFDYGRDVLKENVYEIEKMKIPFTHFPLFTKQSWYLDQQATILQIDGILRSGNPSGAIIKGQISVKPTYEDEDGEDSDEEEDNQDIKKGELEVGGINQKPYEFADELCEEIGTKYPFDMFNQKLLDILHNDKKPYKVRVYIVSAQNLTATGTVIDVKSRLAGMTAKSSANPYPVVLINDGIVEDTKYTKMHLDRDSVIENDLNPQFFRCYDMDAWFPEDWKLTIKIMDKGMFSDQLIGQTVIDIENRLYANLFYMGKYAMDAEQKRIEKEMKKKENKNNKEVQSKLKKKKS